MESRDTSVPQVTLRAAGAADREFLLAVYASTRLDELAVTGWSDDQKEAFCRDQFCAQEAHYLQHYPTAEYAVIEEAGSPAGRWYVDRWPREIRIMDIALLPLWRGRGIGTCVLTDLQREALSAPAASPSSSFCTSLATNCASARSSLTSTTWTSAPAPRGVHRFLPLRLRLLVTTALATSRIACVER